MPSGGRPLTPPSVWGPIRWGSPSPLSPESLERVIAQEVAAIDAVHAMMLARTNHPMWPGYRRYSMKSSFFDQKFYNFTAELPPDSEDEPAAQPEEPIVRPETPRSSGKLEKIGTKTFSEQNIHFQNDHFPPFQLGPFARETCLHVRKDRADRFLLQCVRSATMMTVRRTELHTGATTVPVCPSVNNAVRPSGSNCGQWGESWGMRELRRTSTEAYSIQLHTETG